MCDPRIRQMKIKTGVIRRLIKEKASYEMEAVQLEQKVEKMKADGKDEHDIKKQGEVLQESRGMVPDTVRRLRAAYRELLDYVEKESDLDQAEEYNDAKGVLKSAEPLLA